MCPAVASDFGKISREDVTRYIARHARDRSAASGKAMCWSLRAFLRYLHHKGVTALALADCVPSIRRWKLASLPTYLSAAQVQKILDGCDRPTAMGRRNYAILMLLKQGDFRAQGLYNFNTESFWRPAFLVAAGVTTQYGRDAGGTETELKILATKSVGTPDLMGLTPLSYVPRQVHFNASWFHNYDPLVGLNAERSDRYRVGIGYSQPVSNDLVVVADVYREISRRIGEVTNMFELGRRYILTPQTVVTASVGVGFGNSENRFKSLIGFQHSLRFPYDRP